MLYLWLGSIKIKNKLTEISTLRVWKWISWIKFWKFFSAERVDMFVVLLQEYYTICLFVMKKVWIQDKNLTERGEELVSVVAQNFPATIHQPPLEQNIQSPRQELGFLAVKKGWVTRPPIHCFKTKLFFSKHSHKINVYSYLNIIFLTQWANIYIIGKWYFSWQIKLRVFPVSAVSTGYSKAYSIQHRPGIRERSAGIMQWMTAPRLRTEMYEESWELSSELEPIFWDIGVAGARAGGMSRVWVSEGVYPWIESNQNNHWLNWGKGIHMNKLMCWDGKYVQWQIVLTCSWYWLNVKLVNQSLFRSLRSFYVEC